MKNMPTAAPVSPKSKLRLATKIIIGLAMALLATGSKCTCSPIKPPPPLVITITEVSDMTPDLNDPFTIKWSYTPNSRVKDQFVTVRSLSFDGNISRTFFGCVPSEFRTPDTPAPLDCGTEVESLPCPNPSNIFNNTCRSFVGRFVGPIIVTISAQDSLDNTFIHKSVTLKIPNSHFSAMIETSNTGFPRIPGGGNIVKNIDFMRYFAIANDFVVDDRGNIIFGGGTVIEDLDADLRFNRVFLEGVPFFARSTNAEESQNFGFMRGRSFATLTPEFRETPAAEQQPVTEQRGAADTIVFAGTIILDGRIDITEVKTDNGTESIPTVSLGPSRGLVGEEVLFIQVELVSLLVPLSQVDPVVVSNVRLGNVVQGLVMCTFGCERTELAPSISGAQVRLSRGTENFVGVTGGNIPSAGVAFEFLQRFNAPVSAALTNVSWTNVPVFLDNRLELLLGGN